MNKDIECDIHYKYIIRGDVPVTFCNFKILSTATSNVVLIIIKVSFLQLKINFAIKLAYNQDVRRKNKCK